MTDETDFSNHPHSISELRGNKKRDGSEWTPRDALISALRDLDSGEVKPTSIVIIAGTMEDNNTYRCTYYQSTRNNWEMLGLIEDAKLTLIR